MDLLDKYYAKSTHTNKERKAFTNYMEKKYKEYLDVYHDVKIKFEGEGFSYMDHMEGLE